MSKQKGGKVQTGYCNGCGLPIYKGRRHTCPDFTVEESQVYRKKDKKKEKK